MNAKLSHASSLRTLHSGHQRKPSHSLWRGTCQNAQWPRPIFQTRRLPAVTLQIHNPSPLHPANPFPRNLLRTTSSGTREDEVRKPLPERIHSSQRFSDPTLRSRGSHLHHHHPDHDLRLQSRFYRLYTSPQTTQGDPFTLANNLLNLSLPPCGVASTERQTTRRLPVRPSTGPIPFPW